MTIRDYSINIIEALLFTYLIGRFIDVNEFKKGYFYFLLPPALFIEVTLSNFIVIYDSLYSLIFSAILFLFMYFFQNPSHKMPTENILIFILLFSILISVCQEIDILLIYKLTGLSPIQIARSNWIIIAFFISRFLLFISVSFMTRFTKKYNYLSSSYSRYYVGVFLILYIVITLIEARLYQPVPDITFLCLINILLFSISAFTYFNLCKNLYDNYNSMMNTSMQLYLKEIEMTAELYETKEKELRTMKHELYNQFIILKGFLEHEDLYSSINLINKNIDVLTWQPVYMHSGYTAIDAILNAKLTSARNKKIRTMTSIELGDLSENESYNIAIILGNLLDNAEENIADEKKDIKIRVKCTDKIIIRVTNTTDRKSVDDLSTTKADKINHGLGLLNVRNISEMHNGQLFLDIESGTFTVVVIMDRHT